MKKLKLIIMRNKTIINLEEKRKEVLIKVRENILNENNKLIDNLNYTVKNIYDYDKDEKKYKAMMRIINKLNQLATDIVNIETEEDVVKISNSKNYYLNKVKKELSLRNTREEDFIEYYRNSLLIRESFKEYVWYIRRNNNLVHIKELIIKTNLAEEEKIEANKLIRRERQFSKRLIDKKKKY